MSKTIIIIVIPTLHIATIVEFCVILISSYITTKLEVRILKLRSHPLMIVADGLPQSGESSGQAQVNPAGLAELRRQI